MSPEETRYHDIFDKYYNTILTYIHAHLYISRVQEHLADDITQNVFAVLWLKWPENQYKTDEMLLRWLYNTAYNKILEAGRSEDALQHENIDDHEEAQATYGGVGETDEQLNHEELLKEMESLLAPEYRELPRMIDEGYKYRECAKRLGIPASTVGVVLHRLRKEMQKPENRKKFEKYLR